jgi:Thiol:disulfide interchange protein
LLRILAFIAFIVAACTQSLASDGVRLSLVDGGFGSSGKTALVGLKVDMDAGWHAYWRSPGETGLPPDIKVSVDHGEAQIYWPLPDRFSASGFETVGYRESVIFPIVVRSGSEMPSQLQLSGTLYACSDICVPFPVKETMRLTGAGTHSHEIARWLANAPGGADGSGVKAGSVRKDADDVVVTFSSSERMKSPQAFIDMGMDGFASLKSFEVDGSKAVARFGITNLRNSPVDFSKARLVISDGVTPPIETGFEFTQDTPVAILLVALLGGFILNAMPCVFPVLAIKVFMLMSLDRRHLRVSLAAMSMGVIATFLLLGVVLAIAKGAGHTIGWGMQFQQPIFLAVMATLLCAFGASLSGAFNFILPSSVATSVTAATDGNGVWKSFLQGMVLTLLATPCSAPFVGTAVGYGLTSDSKWVTLSVFAAMGIGMAAPFLLLALFPRVVAALPRPGRWMEHVKHATAVAMFVTAGWLLYLVHATGSTIALVIATTAALLALSLIAAKYRKMVGVQFVALLAVPLMFLVPDLTSSDGVRWQKFEPEAIGEIVKDGRTVFVDISADWCLTCKVNERGVLASDEIVDAMSHIVAMKGDWTRPDEAISSYLKAHGRFGIPLYVVVGPAAPAGILLPEILTKESILDAIKKASLK